MEPSRKFGFWTMTFLVVANMIGAGVFLTSGFSLASLRSPQLVMFAWIVATRQSERLRFSLSLSSCSILLNDKGDFHTK